MPEGLVCSQCGGPLNEDYVCTYCGTRYRKPETQHVTINVTNNYNAAPVCAPPQPAEQEQPAPEPPTENSQEEQPSVSEQTYVEQSQSQEQEQEQQQGSSLEQFVNNSFGLLFILLIGAGALIIGGVNTNNDFMLILGIVVGAIFLFLSSKYHKRKDDDSK